MVTTIAKPRPPVSGGDNGRLTGGNGGGSSSRDNNSTRIGLLFFLATVTMLFGSITSALLIRKSSPDWQSLYFPSLLWDNTVMLLVSSLTLEVGRRLMKQQVRLPYRFWIALTTLLGVSFLVGQLMAWRQLAAHGVFLPTNPHSSFYYLLTGLHGLHLLGGVILLFLATFRSWKPAATRQEINFLSLTATYWHFLAALWIYILFLLYIW